MGCRAVCCCGVTHGARPAAVPMPQSRDTQPRLAPPFPRGRALLAVVALSLVAASPAASADTPREIVLAWTHLYGTDTQQAAHLVTAQFRKGETPKRWARHTQALLTQICYRHHGGAVVTETIQHDVATVVLQASIETHIGRTEQTEIYTLRHIEGQWRIDHLAVRNEVTAWDQDAITKQRQQPLVTTAYRER